MIMNSRQILSLILVVIGIACIVITQTVDFCYETTTFLPNPFGPGGINMPDVKCNNELKNGILYGGIGVSVIGSIIFLLSLKKK
jgi:hypothetical protein